MFISVAEASSGLPQFETSTFSSQAFWSVVSFAILLFLLQKYVIPAINSVLDARGKSIADDLSGAEKARKEAEASLAKYQQQLKEASAKAEETVERARKDAAKLREQNLAELDNELAKKRAEAEESIEQAKRAAIAEIQTTAVDIAMTATEKLVGKAVTKTDASRMVTEAIEEIKKLESNALH
ncbi:F0F1 ATP synthase subunit B [Magnetococcales bacterium HHB-1]